jgi:sec-independent protein translocase protein TatB
VIASTFASTGPSVYIEDSRLPCVPNRVLERAVLDLSLPKLLVLGVLALVIFGPDQLPRLASQAGRALRDLRRLADNARSDLRDGLGPEFGDFDVNDLNPRNFVRKHLMEDPDDDNPSGAMVNGGAANGGAANAGATNGSATNGETINAGSTLGSTATQTLTPGERPPYDSEAT